MLLASIPGFIRYRSNLNAQNVPRTGDRRESPELDSCLDALPSPFYTPAYQVDSAVSTLDYFAIVALLLLIVVGITGVILLLTYLIGPRRSGAIKSSVYESGVDPTGDARKRFNVRFYLVAVLFLVFDVEIVFLYPWAVLYPHLRQPEAAPAVQVARLAEAGYTPGFILAGIGIFFLLLTVGFIYEWRKGVFRWD